MPTTNIPVRGRHIVISVSGPTAGVLTRDIAVNYGPRGEARDRPAAGGAEVGGATRSLPVKRAIFHATSDLSLACNTIRLYRQGENNNSSAVAEMGDRFATIDIG